MMGFGVEDTVGEDVDQITQRGLDSHDSLRRHAHIDRQHRSQNGYIVAGFLGMQLLQTPQQVRIGFDDMQMGVL